ncbi:hypothetical protein BDW02DRAFT_465375, partial [Decorospora gaudefroyi]
PKMIDFGIAFNDNRYNDTRLSGPSKFPPSKVSNNTHTCCLTQKTQEQFAPPNKKHSKQAIDVRSDTWNIGLVMLTLMNGQHVTVASNDFRPQHHPRYATTRVYSSRMEDLMFRCLNIDPNTRPHIMEILYETSAG